MRYITRATITYIRCEENLSYIVGVGARRYLGTSKSKGVSLTLIRFLSGHLEEFDVDF